MTMQLSRRKLLKSTGALVVSFTFAGKVSDVLAQGAASAKPVALNEVDSFLAIDKAGKVTLYTGKVDLGTGIRTALAQMCAEELDVPFNSVSLVTGDTQLTPDQGNTWGSLTIQSAGIQIRNASATARNALLEEAAKKLNVKKEDLTIAEGVVSGGGKKVTYAQLIGGKSFSLKVDEKAKAKDPKDYKLVGKPVARVDIPDKVTGKFTYMQDFRVPGMMHGRVVRPPAYGAMLENVDESSIKNIPGVRVVRDKNFLGVVASSEWNAIRAAQQLKAQWSKAATLPDQAKLWEHVRGTKVVQDQVTSDTGSTKDALAGDGNKISATYDFAVNLHGSIGPSCAISEFKNGKLTSWSASQSTHSLRKQLAQMLAISPDDVRCIYLEGSGCYGRNGHEDAAGDAAILSKAVGQPVRVQWSRADEHGWEPMGPPTLIDIRAAMDSSGNVSAWESDFFIPQQTAGSFLVPLTGATLAGLPQKDDIAPGNVFQNSAIPYKFANVRTVCRRLENTVFRPSWIRTPGRMQNTYANESFMDELAATAKSDPIAFRKKYLDDKRGLELIDRLAALSKWETRPAAQQVDSGNVLKGRGVSYVKYELVRTYVGAVADVEVDRTTGKVRVSRFYLVQDCGQIINPDGVKAQLDGNIIQTVSRTLIEEVKWDRSMVTTLDWASYPIITFPDVPELHYDLIDRPNERPWGAGEPAAAVVPSAIANAIFDATGIRMRSVPFTPAKVKTALGSAA
ncbi:xanthine dehydrogenase family protein molybdopterin-binding subunit [Pseudorhodoplanes sinuspersici]|uniref:Isoquinoline 1-oxidoreductase n=1 Tax=Pseudorhodoplanes sinuspersici TaxID=1235591 RepID=A0A1W6ZTP3_9HYPH|nr:molybdopterin cofactor-binding domain-containing protein [Pseudorhodoplanes sinuspersici]ARQ00767.1 isoquinoline 1-oxidoreductase [Pseudorhodoplanes sinuspersici]RKE72381.1 CO/xanthine dehydrogenase Mo-binding subunit [Pseudorhodoplanes sinuspersici]